MKLLGWDHSQLRVKEDIRRAYLLISEMPLLRNLLACPRSTPMTRLTLFDQTSYSQRRIT